MYSGDHAEPQKPKWIFSVLKFVIAVLVIVALSWLVRTFVVQAYGIPSGSMETTIMEGDMVFAEKISYYFDSPQQGDIVTFEDPETPSRTLIKRVIATEGQTIEFVDGEVVVDGKVLDEPYTNGLPSYEFQTTKYGTNITYPYTVPEGEIWVMGDNRTNSQDSRYFGSISVSSVSCKAVFRYWPLTSLGFLE